jgi:type II secretory pathway component PulF
VSVVATGAIQPGQLVQLASELELLLRAGAPLGQGLMKASNRWSGRLGPSAERLAMRIEAGAPPEAAVLEATELPLVFRSLVAAGLNTRRGADILAAYSASTRELLQLRSLLARGLIYPAIVVASGYGLLILLVTILLPQIAALSSGFSNSPPWWAGLAERLRETVHVWSWLVPTTMLAAWVLLRLIVGRGPGALGWLGVLPVVRGALRDVHTGMASQLLASLLECEVPLPTALSLASEHLRPEGARRAVRVVADRVRAGTPVDVAFREARGAPVLWRALFARETSPAAIRTGLVQVKDVLVQRARARADVLSRLVPVLLLVVIGGGTVAVYAAMLFGPLITLWSRLGGVQQ